MAFGWAGAAAGANQAASQIQATEEAKQEKAIRLQILMQQLAQGQASEQRASRDQQLQEAQLALGQAEAVGDPSADVSSLAPMLAGTPFASRLQTQQTLPSTTQQGDPLTVGLTKRTDPGRSVTNLVQTQEQRQAAGQQSAQRRLVDLMRRGGGELAATALESGASLPPSSFAPPPAPEPFTLGPGQTRFGPDGQVMARGAEPQPAKTGYQWVRRNGQPMEIPEGSARPGDVPYDPSREASGGAGAGALYTQERAQRVVQAVDGLMGQVSRWTVGVGSLLARMPETDARNFAAQLDTLKANIAFGELTEMREAAKTGGALGQVSNIELQLLQSSLGALDTGQEPENFKAQLQQIKDSIMRWNAAKQQFAGGGTAPPSPPASGGSSVQTPDGQTFTFPTPEAAAEFKRAAGIP